MLNELLKRYPSLSVCEKEITTAAEVLVDCYKNGNKLLICGNGGSSADSEHIVGELMKGFLCKRPLSEEQKSKMKANCSEIDEDLLCKLQGALPAIPLSSFTSLNTAFCNDVEPVLNFAQTVLGLGKENDVLLCISTSGNSKNVVEAAKVGKALGLKIIALAGKTGGKLKDIADVCVCVPETETFKVQELHLPVYHYLCAFTEKQFFSE